MSKLDQLLSDEQPIKHCCGQSGTDVETSKQLIKNLMLELIGEDEIIGAFQANTEADARNEFRYDLRQKVEEL